MFNDNRPVTVFLHKNFTYVDVILPEEVQGIRAPVSEILHVYKVLRPGQIRGESWLAGVNLCTIWS
jgi:capsid protein